MRPSLPRLLQWDSLSAFFQLRRSNMHQVKPSLQSFLPRVFFFSDNWIFQYSFTLWVYNLFLFFFSILFIGAKGRGIWNGGDMGRPAKHQQIRKIEQPISRAWGRDQSRQGTVRIVVSICMFRLFVDVEVILHFLEMGSKKTGEILGKNGLIWLNNLAGFLPFSSMWCDCGLLWNIRLDTMLQSRWELKLDDPIANKRKSKLDECPFGRGFSFAFSQ